ncbi:twin-arginine translocation signal domain-containing protein, partial [Muribaculum intestinale]
MHKDINRRDFLRRLGLGGAATAAALAGCDNAAEKTAGKLAASADDI